MNKIVVFTTGGQVQAAGGTYLKRAADDELLDLCKQGEYAYVLTSRQMGKSSLMMATSNELKQSGVRTAVVDLQKVGSDTATAETWYQGFLQELVRKLRLRQSVPDWWKSHSHLGASQRMVLFFETVVLEKISDPVVVFVDEIDTTLKLNFTDDFFIAIRSFYTERAENPAFKRLSFVLIGVATPSDLINDPKRTPFNIGHQVNLTDFTDDEALPLAAGLEDEKNQGLVLLRWVLDWTNGHPYLTQRICAEMVRRPQESWTAGAVKELVAQLFFGDRLNQDDHLKFVRDRILQNDHNDPEYLLAVLGTYREVLNRRQVEDEDQSTVKSQLKLSGAVKRVGSMALAVRNPIYEKVFDRRWVREQLPQSWWQQVKPALPYITVSILVAMAMTGLASYAFYQTQEAKQALSREEIQRQLAEERGTKLQETLTQLQNALRERGIALDDKNMALQLSEERLQDVEKVSAAEKKQRQLAEDEQKRAEAARKAEENQTRIALYRQLAAQGGQVKSQASYLTTRNMLLAIEAMKRAIELEIPSVEANEAIRLGLDIVWAPATVIENLPALNLDDNNAELNFKAEKEIQDKQYIASLESEDTLEITHLPSGQTESYSLPHAMGYILFFEANSQYIVLAPDRNLSEVLILDLSVERNTFTLSLDKPISALSFSPNKRYLATISDFVYGQNLAIDFSIQIWDLASKKEVGRINFPPSFSQLRFSSDNKRIYQITERGNNAWKLENDLGIQSLNLDINIRSLAINNKNDRLIVADQKGSLYALSLEGEKFKLDWKKVINSIDINKVTFNSEGNVVIVGTKIEDDNLPHQSRTRDLPIRSEVRRIKDGEILNEVNLQDIRPYSYSISSNGIYLATINGLWSLISGNKILDISVSVPKHPSHISFSLDSKYLVFSGDVGNSILSIPDGKLLESSSAYYRGGGGSGTEFSTVSSGGKYLVAANYRSQSTLIFNLASGQLINEAKHEGKLSFSGNLAFTLDGEYFATYGGDNFIRIWETSTGNEVAKIKKLGVSDWMFSPDGQYILTSSIDGEINFDVWKPNALVKEACRRLYRNLTIREWQQFIGDEPYRRTCPSLPYPHDYEAVTSLP